MDGLKEIYDSMTSRLKSHVFGSIVISFILWNWKVIYVLCFSEMPIFLRFTYFNMNTSNASLYYWPIGLGLIFGLGAPWVNAAAHWIVSRPQSYIKSRDELSALMREGRLEDKKLEVEQKKTAVQDEKLKAAKLVENQAKAELALSQVQLSVSDEMKKLEAVQKKINAQIQNLEKLELQVEKAEDVSEPIVAGSGLSDIQMCILLAASKQKVGGFKMRGQDERLVNVFREPLEAVIPEVHDARVLSEVRDAFAEFKKLRLVSETNGSYELTSSGYALASKI